MADNRTLSIIPLPARLERTGGEFVLAPETVIVADTLNQSNAAYLHNLLAPPTGFVLPIQADERQVNVIRLATGPTAGPNSYTLSVSPQAIVICWACSPSLNLRPRQLHEVRNDQGEKHE